MRRWLIMLLAVAGLGLSVGACATDGDEEVWPDEEQIRENAKKSHEGLKREEGKHK